MCAASAVEPIELDIFNRAKDRAAGGEQVADVARVQGRRAVFIGRETANPAAVTRLAPLDGLALSGVSRDVAAEVLRAADPACVWLVGMRIESLDLLDPLSRLEALCLQDLTRITDLLPVARHKGLNLLSMSGLTRLEDLEPVGTLAGLKALEIAPGSPVAKTLTLDLSPLRRLRELEVVHLAGTRTPDKSTAVLADLLALRDLDIGGNWPVAELARLAARYPHIQSRWLKPLVANAHYDQGFMSSTVYDIDPADHPQARISYAATGLGKPHELDPEKDAKRIAKLRDEWELHRRRFAAEYGTA